MAIAINHSKKYANAPSNKTSNAANRHASLVPVLVIISLAFLALLSARLQDYQIALGVNGQQSNKVKQPEPLLFAQSTTNLIPPPPMANGLFKLQQLSPASALLANEFFASERHRQLAASSLGLPRSSAPDSFASGTSNQEVAGPAYYSKAAPALQFRLDKYHSLAEIDAYLDALERRFPKRVSLFSIGTTYEGRPIRALEIINNKTETDYVWLDALTHAREWVTGSTILYIIDQILASPSSGIMQMKNYIIIPVVNPDGYSYTWTSNRMWRKNRSRSTMANNNCLGSDINRNFDHSFGGEGSSSDPCSNIFSGSFPFSEAEARSMADLMWSLRERIKFYLTIHSYNQLWACPFASTTEQSASLSKHMRVLREIQRAVKQSGGVSYEIGPLSTSLYVGSGFGLDFAYDKCKIEHSYLVELRDKGTFGFQLPSDQIMPTARETYAGLQAGLRAALGAKSRRA